VLFTHASLADIEIFEYPEHLALRSLHTWQRHVFGWRDSDVV